MSEDFDIILEKIKRLEDRIFWLEKWKKDEIEKQYIEEHRRRRGE